MLKVLTSVIRNKIFKFVCENKYIETNIQKGFWPGVSGTVEHTELLNYILNDARIRQRSVTVTLIDLKNAFGEVHHNLIKSILKIHHIPNEVISMIENLYTDYGISILTKNFITAPIPVERGILQGDCLSPLLFNLCVNSLINTIKDERIHCLGYVNDVSLRPRHWFQFADDAAIISAHNEDNQLLCNAFSKWSSWADLYIRVNKCHTFGMKKFASRVVQYPPIIKISGQLVPPIEDGESFIYLGKQFNFKMDCSNIKVEILDELQAYLKKIDILPINPFYKIRVVQRYVYSKFCWRFSVYPLTISWVRSHMDSLISKYIRKWLQIPISGNISHLKFPKSQLGIDFCSISDIYNQCRVTVRRILKTSVNPEIQQLYTKTSSQNIVTDDIIEQAAAGISEYELKNAAKKIVEKENLAKIWSNFVEMKEQCVIITSITDCCYKMLIKLWHDIVCRMPSNIICFARRSLILSLGNNSNLRCWNIRDSAGCDLCQKMQTQLHVFKLQGCP